jgi:hypothetical protein
MTDLDPAAIMAAHVQDPRAWQNGPWCWECVRYPWPCLTYRLAAEVAALREKVQRVEALLVSDLGFGMHPSKTVQVGKIRAALNGEGAAEEPQSVVHLLNAYTWAGRRAECAVTSEGLNDTEDRAKVTCPDCLDALAALDGTP